MIRDRPTDDMLPVMIAGEQMRVEALSSSVGMAPLSAGAVVFDALNVGPFFLVEDGGADLMGMRGAIPEWPTRPLDLAGRTFDTRMVDACGRPVPWSYMPPMLRTFVQATDRFTIAGTTRTGAGVALASCAVVVFETGRINVPGSPVAAMTTSDGAGAFTVEVPLSTAYQLTGYLAGSPDLAGITKNTVVPGAVDIYLRDPTAADSGGAGGTLVYAFVG